MNDKTGRNILIGMLLCVLAYLLPQPFYGALGLAPPYPRAFFLFALVLIDILLIVLFFLDRLAKFDLRIREHASSPLWLAAGLGGVGLFGAVMVGTMITWNDELSNVEAARFLWDNGLVEYFRNYARLNSWLGPHHPPLLVLMYAVWYKLTGFSLVAGRILNLAFALGGAYLAYLWLRKLTDRAIASLAIVLLPLTPMWAFSSASALLDMPFLFLFFGALLAFERYLETEQSRYAAIAGVIAALAVLSRYNGLFLYPVWLAQILVVPQTRSLLKRPATYLAIGVPLVLGIPWLAVSLSQGTLVVQANRISQFLLVALTRPGGWRYLTEVLLPLFPVMMGVYNIPLQLFGLSGTWRLDTPGSRRLVVSAVTYLTLVLFTLPHPRYSLPVVPMVAALSAAGLWRLNYREQGMAAVGLATALCALSFLVFYTVITRMDLIYIFY
jgi:4-amino-4-deoxy-L-arabinose transferase-like glycosyltransferase